MTPSNEQPQAISRAVAINWLSILVVPLVEAIVLMALPRTGPIPLGLRIGYLDLLLPFPTAFIVMMFLLERGEPSRLALQKGPLAVNLAAMAAALYWHPGLWLVVLSVSSAFCLWVSPRYYLRNPYRSAIVPCALIAFSVSIYLSIPDSVYGAVGKLTSQVTGSVVSTFLGPNMRATVASNGQLTVASGSFSAIVEKKCWGVDGFFYFTILFLLSSALYRKGRREGRWFTGYFVGLALMFSMNILRVLLLLGFGAWAYDALGPQEGGKLLRTIVHPHLGWLLYTPAMILYIPLCLRFAGAKRLSDPFQVWGSAKTTARS